VSCHFGRSCTVSSLCISRVHIWNNSKNAVSKECQLQNHRQRIENIQNSRTCVSVLIIYFVYIRTVCSICSAKARNAEGVHEMSWSELLVFCPFKETGSRDLNSNILTKWLLLVLNRNPFCFLKLLKVSCPYCHFPRG